MTLVNPTTLMADDRTAVRQRRPPPKARRRAAAFEPRTLRVFLKGIAVSLFRRGDITEKRLENILTTCRERHWRRAQKDVFLAQEEFPNCRSMQANVLCRRTNGAGIVTNMWTRC